jgi:hypothetical protein
LNPTVPSTSASPTLLTKQPTTSSPTFPTFIPTIKPTTGTPTTNPSKAPTALPTYPIKSAAPTKAPSKSPVPTTLSPSKEPTRAPTPSNNIGIIEKLLMCRMPFGINPVLSTQSDVALCAGWGQVSLEQSQLTTTQDLFELNLFPRCLQLIFPLSGHTFELQSSTNSILAMLYLDQDNNILTIINYNELYLNGVLLEAWDAERFEYIVAEQNEQIECRNEYYSTNNAETFIINGNYQKLKNYKIFSSIFLDLI